MNNSIRRGIKSQEGKAMELNFTQIKEKKVINVADGKDLGKITDIAFSFPEGKIVSVTAKEKKLCFSGDCYEIGLCCIEKIGDDAILVRLEKDANKE